MFNRLKSKTIVGTKLSGKQWSWPAINYQPRFGNSLTIIISTNRLFQKRRSWKCWPVIMFVCELHNASKIPVLSRELGNCTHWLFERA